MGKGIQQAVSLFTAHCILYSKYFNPSVILDRKSLIGGYKYGHQHQTNYKIFRGIYLRDLMRHWNGFQQVKKDTHRLRECSSWKCFGNCSIQIYVFYRWGNWAPGRDKVLPKSLYELVTELEPETKIRSWSPADIPPYFHLQVLEKSNQNISITFLKLSPVMVIGSNSNEAIHYSIDHSWQPLWSYPQH